MYGRLPDHVTAILAWEVEGNMTVSEWRLSGSYRVVAGIEMPSTATSMGRPLHGHVVQLALH